MTPLELVAHISEGLPVSPTDLDAFITANRTEGQHLDYKSGKLASESHGPAEVRRHLSGMANVSGGVLIIGVQDDLVIDGVGAKGSRSARGWAANSVSQLAAYFTTPPHFCEVEHAKGTVLIAAVHRNGKPIPVIEQGRMRYYLRMADQTMEAPEVLVTDLLLGRRELPIVELRVEKGEIRKTADGHDYVLELDLFNEGQIWIEEAQVGLIGWNVYRDQQPKDKLPNAMRASLNAIVPSDRWELPENIALHYVTEHCGKVPPLSAHRGIHLGALRIDSNAIRDGRIVFMKAAIFCVPRNGSIQWFQLSCGIARVQFGQIMASPPLLVPVSGGELAEIAWHMIKKPPPELNMGKQHDWESILADDECGKVKE